MDYPIPKIGDWTKTNENGLYIVENTLREAYPMVCENDSDDVIITFIPRVRMSNESNASFPAETAPQ